jgi:predicted membrane chloride channel (bestrophin family)
VAGNHNLALQLLGRQSQRIFQAYAAGILSGLDNFNMETALAGLSQQQAIVERTAARPTPRTYDVFSRYLVHLYVIIFPGEILTSRTVVDLTAGSGITFDDRGEHELKGVPDKWRLFVVTPLGGAHA